jgi:hypothetical protein
MSCASYWRDKAEQLQATLNAERKAQSLSLSEARERGDEYERLYRQTHLDYVAAEYRLDAVSAAIGSPRFMDPPDGGDVSLADQVRRMRAELEAKEARLAALENGPAALADAHTNPPLSDLSSLRKGAEL